MSKSAAPSVLYYTAAYINGTSSIHQGARRIAVWRLEQTQTRMLNCSPVYMHCNCIRILGRENKGRPDGVIISHPFAL